MDEAASSCNGGMMAVLSIEPERINSLINELGLEGKIVIANDNAPDQVVLSGDKASLDSLSAKIIKEGRRCKKLNVSGPWVTCQAELGTE